MTEKYGKETEFRDDNCNNIPQKMYKINQHL